MIKKILKWIVIGFVALIVLGLIFGKSNDIPETEKVITEEVTEVEVITEVKQAVVVDLAAFVKEFDKNQLSAEEKYKDTLVQFTGYIDNISDDMFGNYFVILQPSADEYYWGTSVKCYFEDKAQLIALENGQKATLQGIVDTQSYDVLVKTCIVVKD